MLSIHFTRILELFPNVGPKILKGPVTEEIKPNGTIYNRQDMETTLSNIIGNKSKLIYVPSKTDVNVELIQEIQISYTIDFKL